MTLPASGSISLGQVNVELGKVATTLASMNATDLRTLAGVPSGAISMSDFHGKSNTYNILLGIQRYDATAFYGWHTSFGIGSASPNNINGNVLTNIYISTANISNVDAIDNATMAAIVATYTKMDFGDGILRTLNWVHSAPSKLARPWPDGDANTIAMKNYFVANNNGSVTVRFI